MSIASSRRLLGALAFLALTGLAAAQGCPPLPSNFSGTNGLPANGNDNLAYLEVFADDSTDILNGDNFAAVSLGHPISLTFIDDRVPAGLPFLMAFSVGVPAPISVPTAIDGLVWLDVATPGNIFNILDGFGVFSPIANPFATTPGPGGINAYFGTVGTNAALAGVCVTVQVLVADPAGPAPFFYAMSNPVALEIRPGVTDLLPAYSPPSAPVTMIAPGANAGGGDTVLIDGLPLAISTAGPGFVVPPSAVSGYVTVDVGGIVSSPSADGVEDYLVVTDPAGNQTAVGTLNLTPDPNLGGGSRGTGIATLLGAGSNDTWNIAVNAGDLITIEVYSIDSTTMEVLDGRGSLFNTQATRGFDPFIQLQHQGNVDALTYDTAGGPFNIHFDDDGGPVNNARMQWQTRYTGSMNIIVGDANPGAFVTGEYLLNVVVESGIPAVASFQNASATRINIAAVGAAVTINGPNIVAGNAYDVIMSPRAGAPFADRVIPGVAATVNGQLTFNIPTVVPGDLPTGVHQVRLRDLSTLREGLPWNVSQFFPANGVLPDLLSIKAFTTIPAAAGTTIMTPNLQSVTWTGVTANGFIQAAIPANAIAVYCEALGVSLANPNLFDAANSLSTPGTFIYNPNIKVFRPGLATGPYNEDNGVFPTQYFAEPLGIGRNAAVVDIGIAGNFLFLIQQNITFGATSEVLVNISYL